MRGTAVIALAAVLAAASCTYETTQVEPPKFAPVPAPAPTVIYQQPRIVSAQAPVIAAPAPGVVSVTYSGEGGLQIATQKALAYCAQYYGSGRTTLATDDGVGHATFNCP
jgi:hypothetical protein